MAKIYTKTGDQGKTSLYGGQRVGKDHPQIQAYGELDELTSWIGHLLNYNLEDSHAQFLKKTQKNLYKTMAHLSGAVVDLNFLGKETAEVEKLIDESESLLPKIVNFIVPAGSHESSFFHVVRTVCRRAERALVKAETKPEILGYVNRLSDLFFVLARRYNQSKEEILRS